MTLQRQLEELRQQHISHEFALAEIPDKTKLFIGIDSQGRTGLFIEEAVPSTSPSIRTAKIQVEFGRLYSIFDGHKNREGYFSCIRCLSSDREDNAIFVNMLDSIVIERKQLSDSELSSIFYSLVNLFKTPQSKELTKDRQGLWGELFFMRARGGFLYWAPYWHSDNYRLFDFSVSTTRVEVKTTLRPDRIHDFSHRQLYSIGQERIVIISVMLTPDDAGLSLKSLVEEARSALRGSEHYFKLEQAVIAAGMSNGNEVGPQFNAVEAATQMKPYSAESVPRFTVQEPAGVSGTTYRSNLATVPCIDKADFDLFLAELPTK